VIVSSGPLLFKAVAKTVYLAAARLFPPASRISTQDRSIGPEEEAPPGLEGAYHRAPAGEAAGFEAVGEQHVGGQASLDPHPVDEDVGRRHGAGDARPEPQQVPAAVGEGGESGTG
jgi:hypothetical protein